MITQEPILSVGIIERASIVRGTLRGLFRTPGGQHISRSFHVRREGKAVFVIDEHEAIVASGYDITLRATSDASFVLHDVTIGIGFHWERKEDQEFTGDLRLLADGEGVTAVNTVGLEAYLSSVISSEMSASSPSELLRAHAITSRSWMAAMLERRSHADGSAVRERVTDDEIVRWYDREDHTLFDVCADDHCQRYQGVSKIISDEARSAVETTRGLFLVSGETVCDARFFKACGGRTEDFGNAWEAIDIPYLRSVSDAPEEIPAVDSEETARTFIDGSPGAWCNTSDPELLRTILPDFDQETTDFFRWRVEYTVDELSSIIGRRSGIDFGTIQDLVPLERGPSGRIVRLRVVGSKRTLVVGKELEIRKWLSDSHLYRSAFHVTRDEARKTFLLVGAGWGHGVGLCQIGAAAMAAAGKTSDDIVLHYFRGAELKKLYR